MRKPTKLHTLIFRQVKSADDPQVLLVAKQNGHGTNWHFPADFLEELERPDQAAERIALEQVGIERVGRVIDLENEVRFVSKLTGKMETEAGYAVEVKPRIELDLSDDYDEARWVDPEEAFMLLQWDSFRDSLQALLQVLQER